MGQSYNFAGEKQRDEVRFVLWGGEGGGRRGRSVMGAE